MKLVHPIPQKIKPFTAFLLVSFFAHLAFGTIQQPDKLAYQGKNIFINIGYWYPSPLQVYYYQTKQAYPFQRLSTANYRGHVGNWEIEGNKFYLTSVEIDDSLFSPKKFDIQSLSTNSPTQKKVFADWFSGILECVDRDLESYETLHTYYFLIRKGVIVEQEIHKGFSFNFNTKLSRGSESYQAFYLRLQNDHLYIGEESCRLQTSGMRKSPIFELYGKDFLDWPYNWENEEKSGAPLCIWVLEDKKLFLKEITLHYGLMIDSSFSESLNLSEEFPQKISQNGLVFAHWANGIYSIKHGELKPDRYLEGELEFVADSYTLLNIKNGIITASFKIPDDFDPDNMPDTTDPQLRKMVDEYFK